MMTTWSGSLVWSPICWENREDAVTALFYPPPSPSANVNRLPLP